MRDLLDDSGDLGLIKPEDILERTPERFHKPPISVEETQIRTKKIGWWDFAAFKINIQKSPDVVEVLETGGSTPEELQKWRQENRKQQISVSFGSGLTVTITQNQNDQLIWSTRIQASPDLKTGKERKEDIETKQTEYLKHLVALMLKLPEVGRDPAGTVIQIESIQPADDAFIEKTKRAFLQEFRRISYEDREYTLDEAGKVVLWDSRNNQRDHTPHSSPGLSSPR